MFLCHGTTITTTATLDGFLFFIFCDRLVWVYFISTTTTCLVWVFFYVSMSMYSYYFGCFLLLL